MSTCYSPNGAHNVRTETAIFRQCACWRGGETTLCTVTRHADWGLNRAASWVALADIVTAGSRESHNLWFREFLPPGSISILELCPAVFNIAHPIDLQLFVLLVWAVMIRWYEQYGEFHGLSAFHSFQQATLTSTSKSSTFLPHHS